MLCIYLHEVSANANPSQTFRNNTPILDNAVNERFRDQMSQAFLFCVGVGLGLNLPSVPRDAVSATYCSLQIVTVPLNFFVNVTFEP